MIPNNVFSAVALLMAGLGICVGTFIGKEKLSPWVAFGLMVLTVTFVSILPYLKGNGWFEFFAWWMLVFLGGLATVYAFRSRLRTDSVLVRVFLYFTSSFMCISLFWVLFVLVVGWVGF